MGRSAVIFLGPSLPPHEAQAIVQADYRGPAALGDLTRASSECPPAIVLIDGTFESGPSVWHKEILWALSRGIAVIGASSMGALRAAELSDFGMLGWGHVFEDFRVGRRNDDDEVAVVHAPKEFDFMPLSDAMIDIRSGVRLAVAERYLNNAEGQAIIETAKARHFKYRNLSDAVQESLTSTRGATGAKSVAQWFKHRNYGVKAADVRSLLSQLDYAVSQGRERAKAAPEFLETVYLSELKPYGFTTQCGL